MNMMYLLLYLSLFFFLIIILCVIIFIYIRKFKDFVIYIRKNNNHTVYRCNLRDSDSVEVEESVYPLETVKHETTGKRIVYIDEGNYNKCRDISHLMDSWIDSKTAIKIMNDKHIRDIVSGKDNVLDMLIMIGAISSIIGTIGIAYLVYGMSQLLKLVPKV